MYRTLSRESLTQGLLVGKLLVGGLGVDKWFPLRSGVYIYIYIYIVFCHSFDTYQINNMKLIHNRLTYLS